MPRNRFPYTYPLFRSRGKVVALETLRIPSPGPKMWVCVQHRSNRLAAFILIPRRARPEGRIFFSGKSLSLSGENVNFWFACPPLNFTFFRSPISRPDLETFRADPKSTTTLNPKLKLSRRRMWCGIKRSQWSSATTRGSGGLRTRCSANPEVW